MAPFPFDIVVFDLDGTLADTAPDLAVSLNHALGALGRPLVPDGRVRDLIGHGARTLMRRGLETSGEAPDALVEAALGHFMDHYAANICTGTSCYPAVEETMEALAGKGVRLAICTNKPEHLSHLLVAALGWEGRFAAVVGGDTLSARKPDPAPLVEAIARAGGGRAAFVGDSIVDAETARAAGVPFVAVSFGFADRPVAELGAAAVIDDYAELAPALERVALTHR